MSGEDFVAAKDQAMAALSEKVGSDPQQFILVWGSEDAFNLGTVIFAKPEFVIAAIQQLTMALLNFEPTVNPPEGL